MASAEEESNVRAVRAFLAAIESGQSDDALAGFYAENVRQIELPNRLNPAGQESDLVGLRKRGEQGRKVLRGQRYDVVSVVAQGSRVAVEALWTGVLAVPVAALPAGAEMKAHFAMFFEFENGRVVFQRNYDCFEPW